MEKEIVELVNKAVVKKRANFKPLRIKNNTNAPKKKNLAQDCMYLVRYLKSSGLIKRDRPSFSKAPQR